MGSTFISRRSARHAIAALLLIEGGHLTRERLRRMSVADVRTLCGSIVAQHRALEEMAKQTKRPRAELEATKRLVSNAGSRVADRIRAGSVAPRNIPAEVETRAHAAGY